MSDIITTVVSKKLEKKSYTTIGEETGISRQYAQQIVKKYIKQHPEAAILFVKEKKEKRNLKVGGKGHNRDKDNKIGDESDMIINGHTARFLTKYVKCGKAGCKVCAESKGHGPYKYLIYRDEHGKAIHKYVGKVVD